MQKLKVSSKGSRASPSHLSQPSDSAASRFWRWMRAGQNHLPDVGRRNPSRRSQIQQDMKEHPADPSKALQGGRTCPRHGLDRGVLFPGGEQLHLLLLGLGTDFYSQVSIGSQSIKQGPSAPSITCWDILCDWTPSQVPLAVCGLAGGEDRGSVYTSKLNSGRAYTYFWSEWWQLAVLFLVSFYSRDTKIICGITLN